MFGIRKATALPQKGEKTPMSSRKRIVLVGPVYPYKGGISHYTGLMYRTLSERNDVYMMSYKLQYPKILFRKEQRDYSNDAFKIDGVDFRINTANPFSWVGAAAKIRKLKPDLVIMQWWHPYFAPCYRGICRLLGDIKVLFICHNVFPHERFPMDKFLTRHALGSGEYFIVQSAQDEADLLSIKKDAVYRRTVHPTYNVFRLQGLTREEGRKLLRYGEEEKLLLFFGFVREYKGLKHLLRAMPAVVDRLPETRLLVVGDFDGDKDSYLEMISGLGISGSVDICDGYIPDREVEKYFAACDLVVLPYESATQSGIVQIAYGFEKPVVATRVGGLPEVVLDGKTGYVVEPFESDELASKIVEFFLEGRADSFRSCIKAEARKYSWDRMADLIDDFGGIGRENSSHRHNRIYRQELP